MAGRSKDAAKDDFCGYFKESLSCITDAFLHPIQKSPNRYLLTYEPPAALLCDVPHTLSATQVFSIVPDKVKGGFKAKTHEYSYSLNGDIDGIPGEIVSYHWHPEGTEVSYPHLHVGRVPRVHFPTARISVERFIRMLIDYYDIEAMFAESKWKRILERNNKAFDSMVTWK